MDIIFIAVWFSIITLASYGSNSIIMKYAEAIKETDGLLLSINFHYNN